MTSSSPSFFPAVGGTVAAEVSSPAVSAPRPEAPGLRFDDYYRDESPAQGPSQPGGKKDAPPIDAAQTGTGALDLDKPVEDSRGIEPLPEAEAENDVAVASEEANPLVIAISRADLRNPAKLLAAIAAAIASQSGNDAPRELQLVLQPAGGTQSAGAATKTISVPLVAEDARTPDRGPGRTMAATIAAVVQAALSYAKTVGVAPTRDAPEPASITSGAASRASAGKPVSPTAVPAGVGEGEKTAATKLNPVAAAQDGGKENFLTSASQSLVRVPVRAGIDGALQGESMKSVPRQHQNSVAAHLADLRGGTTSGAAAAENTFNAWKGWTNSGGEQTATAARFSQVSERMAGLMANAAAPAASAPPPNAAASSAAPVVPAFPVSEAALLGPLGNAVERMILRGQDQLSLTIRFEQGGSLALRLALRNGEIKTDIRTDVAGLENALRSAWSTFAQDWNGRGVKLAAPVFSTNPESTPDQQQPAAHRDGRNGAESGEAASRFPGQSHLGGALRNSRGRPAAPVALDQSSRSHEHGLHVWA